MPTVRFFGFTWPSGMDITLHDIPEVTWQEAALSLKMLFRIKIKSRKIEVECEVNHYRDEFKSTLYMRALDLVRVPIDLLAFATGLSATVFLDSFAKPDEDAEPLWFGDPALAPLCTAFVINPKTPKEILDFGRVIELVGSEPALFMALNDLVQANTMPHQAHTNCARVIDGLRKLVAPGLEPKPGWITFQNTINADTAYLSFITDHSKGPRHGDRSYIPGAIGTEVVKRTWIIMNRFLEYRKRGENALPPAEFPLLLG